MSPIVVVATAIDDGLQHVSRHARFRSGRDLCRSSSDRSITWSASAEEKRAPAGVRAPAPWKWRPPAWPPRAPELGLPFYCVRAVTDLADESLANDFNRALRPDGHFDTISILSLELCAIRRSGCRSCFGCGAVRSGLHAHWGSFLPIADSDLSDISRDHARRGLSRPECRQRRRDSHARHRPRRDPDSRGSLRNLPHRSEENRVQPAGAAAHLRPRNRRRGGGRRRRRDALPARATALSPFTTFPAWNAFTAAASSTPSARSTRKSASRPDSSRPAAALRSTCA